MVSLRRWSGAAGVNTVEKHEWYADIDLKTVGRGADVVK